MVGAVAGKVALLAALLVAVDGFHLLGLVGLEPRADVLAADAAVHLAEVATHGAVEDDAEVGQVDGDLEREDVVEHDGRHGVDDGLAHGAGGVGGDVEGHELHLDGGTHGVGAHLGHALLHGWDDALVAVDLNGAVGRADGEGGGADVVGRNHRGRHRLTLGVHGQPVRLRRGQGSRH